MSDKIETCKPSLISNRPDFSYRLEYIAVDKALWQFELHTMSAKQRGAITASLAVTRLNEGKLETEIESNMELVHTATIYNALTSWNLDEPISLNNIDLLPKDVRDALVKAINAHEANNDSTLEAELKN